MNVWYLTIKVEYLRKSSYLWVKLNNHTYFVSVLFHYQYTLLPYEQVKDYSIG